MSRICCWRVGLRGRRKWASGWRSARRGGASRQLLIESLLLACGGAVLGILFAVWGTRLLRRFVEFGGSYSTTLDVSPDLTVFLFLTGATLASALIFGFV
ncbi:MAG: FtsX-like permease family protein, partial [Bryobacteraceae bacterium]